MLLLEQRKEKLISTPIKEVRPDQIKAATSALAAKILEHLAEHPTYPKALSNSLKVHEQKVYYHIRRLEKSGLVEVLKTEPVHGTEARVYGLTKPAFALRFGKTHTDSINLIGAQPQTFLEPFIEKRRASRKHHSWKPRSARARDGKITRRILRDRPVIVARHVHININKAKRETRH